jgi:hypothetical protein
MINKLIQELVGLCVTRPNLKMSIHRHKVSVSGFYESDNGVNNILGLSVSIQQKDATQQLQSAIERVKSL